MCMILETERLVLWRLTLHDYDNLCRTLQDEQAMYAYEAAFTDAEVQQWLERQLQRYRDYGFGLWAVVQKETGVFVGQCGITVQPWKGEEVLEIGYLPERRYWHQSYATEAARICKGYAFQTLGVGEVCSIVRDNNIASQKVALRNGMTVVDGWTKHYRGVICYTIATHKPALRSC